MMGWEDLTGVELSVLAEYWQETMQRYPSHLYRGLAVWAAEECAAERVTLAGFVEGCVDQYRSEVAVGERVDYAGVSA